ncbi:unnamed protein product, partial [Aphanomyces euteiches]
MANLGPTDPLHDPGHENPVDAAPLESDDISIPPDLPPLESIPEVDTDEETDEGPQLESTPLQDKTRVPTNTFSEKPVTILPTQLDLKGPLGFDHENPGVLTQQAYPGIISAVLDKTANKTTKPDSAKQEFPINWEIRAMLPRSNPP